MPGPNPQDKKSEKDSAVANEQKGGSQGQKDPKAAQAAAPKGPMEMPKQDKSWSWKRWLGVGVGCIVASALLGPMAGILALSVALSVRHSNAMKRMTKKGAAMVAEKIANRKNNTKEQAISPEEQREQRNEYNFDSLGSQHPEHYQAKNEFNPAEKEGHRHGKQDMPLTPPPRYEQLGQSPSAFSSRDSSHSVGPKRNSGLERE